MQVLSLYSFLNLHSKNNDSLAYVDSADIARYASTFLVIFTKLFTHCYQPCSLPSQHTCRLEDPHSGIAAEFSKWERRRTLLVSVIEQLREREMKAIITALVASKSKVLKRWKAIDAR